MARRALRLTDERGWAMLRTQFTELVGCTVPIQQAGLGTLANPDLAAAVANAGGQGMISVAGAPPELLTRILDGLRAQTSAAVGCNFLMPFVGDEVSECVGIAAQRTRVIDFFWGEPDRALVDIVHEHRALACWQVGSREEAVAAADAGCDLIVAQGIEAGGHVRSRVSLLALLGEVLDAVDLPIVAAGGISSGRAMAAALAAGAAAVRVGTRFIAAEEAAAHPVWLNALFHARAQDTVYTEAFGANWPNAPHRVLRDSLEAASRFEGDVVAEWTSPYSGMKRVVRKFEASSAPRYATGRIDVMPHWAGEGVGAVRRVQSAAEIVREMATEAEHLLKRWA